MANLAETEPKLNQAKGKPVRKLLMNLTIKLSQPPVSVSVSVCQKDQAKISFEFSWFA